MTLDIKGGLKNTKISSNVYVAFEELLSNAIDSYLIRRNKDHNCPPFQVDVTIRFFQNSLLETNIPDVEITCTDNGAGFGDSEVKAFVTKDTTFKDYLNISGIGKCKGAGRIQFFHYFSRLEIDSVYASNGKTFRRSLVATDQTREVSDGDFTTTEAEAAERKTTIKLSILKQIITAGNQAFDARPHFSAHAVRSHLYISFLQRLIILRGNIGTFSITIREENGDNPIETKIDSNELPSPVESREVPLICSHGNEAPEPKQLKVTTYALPSDEFRQTQHDVALCANSALVLSIVKEYIRNQADRKKPIEGKIYLVLVESEILESQVNEQRDNFEIARDCNSGGDLYTSHSLQDIIESLEDYVYGILTPKDFDKDTLIASTQERFGISRSMLEKASVKVHYSDTEENIAKRVLKKLQEEIVQETNEIFSLKDELSSLDPRSEDFRTKISDISWKHTSSMQLMDMANLSQLVVRRSCMLEILRRAVSLMLDCQTQKKDGARNEHEKIIHNIFFPRGKDSRDSVDHDIWILNEEYHYFDHIASDKPLASIPWNDQAKLFSPDIDASLEELFKKNNTEHQMKRPDIAIFNQEGSAIIIEFKAPGVPLQEHIADLAQYARLLAAKSNSRIKKFYCYLIGDTIDESRMALNYKRFPSGTGYFSTDPLRDPATEVHYGEMYSEILLYSQFISRAENRLSVFKKKLNVSL